MTFKEFLSIIRKKLKLNNLMSDITIIKTNNSFLKIQCEVGIKNEISEHYKFWVESARFQKSFKEKIWDGFIRLYHKPTSTLPYGLLKDFLGWCKNNNYSVALSGFEKSILVETSEIDSFIKQLNLHSDNKKIEPYDFQNIGIHHALQKKRAVLKSPTGSGKSLMIYCIAQFIKSKGGKVLIVVPTVNLVNQIHSDFKDYSSENYDIDIDKTCHKIMAGVSKEVDDYDIVISTWQSLIRLSEEWFKKFDCLIIDECHTAKAGEISKIVEKCTEASYKIGTSGTAGSGKIDKMQLKALFGDEIELTTTRKQMDIGNSASLQIKVLHLLEKSESVRKTICNATYQQEKDYIKSLEKRKSLICKLALKQTDTCLVLFDGIEYGKELYNAIKKISDKPIFYIDGSIFGIERERIRKFANDNKCILVCSYQTFSTGINIKNLNILIFATPVKSEIRTLQSIGRIIRLGNSQYVYCYDLVDDYSYKKSQNYSLKHFLENRLEYYNREKLDYSVVKIEY